MTIILITTIVLIALIARLVRAPHSEKLQLALLCALVAWLFMLGAWVDGKDMEAGIYLSLSPLAGFTRKQLFKAIQADSVMCLFSPGMKAAIINEGSNQYDTELAAERELEDKGKVPATLKVTLVALCMLVGTGCSSLGTTTTARYCPTSERELIEMASTLSPAQLQERRTTCNSF